MSQDIRALERAKAEHRRWVAGLVRDGRVERARRPRPHLPAGRPRGRNERHPAARSGPAVRTEDPDPHIDRASPARGGA